MGITKTSHADQQELMTENQRSRTFSVSKPAFIGLKALPLILSFILAYIQTPILISLLVVTVSCAVDIFFTKEYFGLGLVGLRWYQNKSEAQKFPHIVYHSKPLPFVASTIDSNVFWLGLLLATVGWVLSAIFYGFLYGTKWLLICSIVTIAQLMNFSAFMKCHNAGKEQADSIARTLLLDKNVSFQAAKNDEELSAESEGELEQPDGEQNKTTVLEAETA